MTVRWIGGVSFQIKCGANIVCIVITMLIIRTIIKNIITLMVIATVFGCSNPAEDKEYPKIYYTGHSSCQHSCKWA